MIPGTLPRPLRRLLERWLPPDRVEDVLGDLEASYAVRRARAGPWRARLWLFREAAALLRWSRSWKRGASAGPGRPPRLAQHEREGWTMGTDVLQDLRFGLRTLLRRPGFALTAVAVLALGIGASTTVLTLVTRIFMEPPAGVADPDRLVRLHRSFANGVVGGSFSYPDYLHYRDGASTLEGVAAWSGLVTASLSGDDAGAGQLDLVFTSDNWFELLGVRAAAGRFFRPEENASREAPPVLVLSDGFWRRGFGADPNAVGRTVSINGIPFRIVGVAPPRFAGTSPIGSAPDAWAPIAQFGAVTGAGHTAWWERLPNEQSTWLSVIGRMAPGVTFEAARSNVEALSAALTYEGRNEGEGVVVSRDYLYTPAQAASLRGLTRMLLAVVGFVLLIAVANVAVLLLSRATTRSAEMDIRSALGAGRGRIVRQLLAESLALALAGGALGCALAWALSDAAASLLPYAFGRDFTPDARVLGATAGITLLTALAAGLAPALGTVRGGASGGLASARVVTGRSRTRDALVVGQVLLSMVLVAGAVLFARSFLAARGQDLGFETRNLLVLQVDLRGQGTSPEEGQVFVGRALERLRALPGVTGVTTARMIPFRGEWSTSVDPPPGVAPDDEGGSIWVGLNTVGPDYFDVMGVEIARGRALGPNDVEGGAPAVVLNETLAARLFPGEDALGRSFPFRDGVPFTVVGVARDAVYYELGEPPRPQLYGSVFQVWQPTVHFIVRTSGPPTDLAAAARRAIREVEPGLAFGLVTTMASVFEDVTARYRVSALLVGLFGGLALVLAAAGLYGVVSFLVAQRAREIGVRMALGAGRGRVAREVLRSGVGLAATGVLLGLVAAAALRGLTASLLFGVSPTDPWPLAIAAAVLLGVAALATLAPARRASRVDPLVAMRTE